jgi:Fe-S-cluster containining protein
MADNNLIEQLSRQFETDGYMLASQSLKHAPIHVSALMESTRNFYAYMDSFLNDFEYFSEKQEHKIDCQKGCSSCCYQAVFITPFEALYAANFIRKHMPKNLQDNILERVKAKHSQTHEMDAKTCLNYRHACPLLDLETNSCMVHTVRPQACRLFLSSDVSSCEASYHNPEKHDIFARLYDLPLKTGRAFCSGYNAWLSEQGLHVDELKLEDAMLEALENPRSADEWVQGYKNFKGHYSNDDFEIFKNHITKPGNIIA